jgi:hypothetical protein
MYASGHVRLQDCRLVVVMASWPMASGCFSRRAKFEKVE